MNARIVFPAAIVLVFFHGFVTSVHAKGGSGVDASDPTAAVSYVDLRLQTFDLFDSAERDRYALEGAYVAGEVHKLSYQVNYWDTDVSGEDESGLESLRAQYMHIQSRERRNGFAYRLVVGAELILDQGDLDDGIGSGTDQVAPLIGAGWNFSENNSLATLLQHFYSVSEEDDADRVRTTMPRLIWMYHFADIDGWLKVDNQLYLDHEDGHRSSNVIEIQLGKMFMPGIGGYVEYLTNNAGAKIYDDGWGLGLRMAF